MLSNSSNCLSIIALNVDFKCVVAILRNTIIKKSHLLNIYLQVIKNQEISEKEFEKKNINFNNMLSVLFCIVCNQD